MLPLPDEGPHVNVWSRKKLFDVYDAATIEDA
jgi:hypothetical protein